MNVKEYLKKNILFFDGGMGTLLQERGLPRGEFPEEWNLSHGEEIKAIHKAYFDVGCNIATTNTFGANLLKFEEKHLREIVFSAVSLAKKAAEESTGKQKKFVALDIGPSGKLLAPFGDLDFEDAVRIFSETAKFGAEAGADLVIIETMNDAYETKAALLAVKESCSLPVFVSNAYSEGGTLMTGADPASVVALLEGLGADAVGVNCSFGPGTLRPVVKKYLEFASVPVLFQPNAGLPRMENGRTVYDISPAEFAKEVAEAVSDGVRIVGGCCGTTPEYLGETIKILKGKRPVKIIEKERTVISCNTHAVTFGKLPILIGERVNPTGKKRLKQALIERDMDYLLQEGIREEEAGADAIDVNVGLPEIDEKTLLPAVIKEMQAVVSLPLQIDTSDIVAMERAMRICNGKPLVNSVNGKADVMKAVFPLVKKYGGVVVALTLDEKGIPETAAGRVKIAEKILSAAKTWGLGKKDLLFDPLAMTVSASPTAAKVTLDAVRTLHEMGCLTTLGVSNVSFGLPNRELVNGTFFALALENGLDAAILNPLSAEMMKTYHTYNLLKANDENCARYLAFAENLTPLSQNGTGTVKKDTENAPDTLQNAICKGLRDRAEELTKELLKTREPLDVVKEEILPALDSVGKDFEAKKVYLPQLLMSAETAKVAFEEVKKTFGETKADKCEFVLATVEGDIHDIGKNIVKLLLENYGFSVIDLGKDVPVGKVVETVVERKAPLVGLSALMTTTVPKMEETIRELKAKAPFCHIVVGGAVLTKSFAEEIGADAYSKDAMETVRYAETVYENLKS